MKTVWLILLAGLWVCSFCFSLCWCQNKATITLFFFNIDNFQSVNKLYPEITSQGSLKSMWFVDRHCCIRISNPGLIRDGKLSNLLNLSEFRFSYLWNEGNHTCIEDLFKVQCLKGSHSTSDLSFPQQKLYFGSFQNQQPSFLFKTIRFLDVKIAYQPMNVSLATYWSYHTRVNISTICTYQS